MNTGMKLLVSVVEFEVKRGTGRIEATDQVLGLSVSGLEGLFHRELAGLMAPRAVALVCRVPKPSSL